MSVQGCNSHDCKPDWKAYALGELDAIERRQAEACAEACPSCRQELASVRLTLDALSTLQEQEIPQRIALVSDRVPEAPRWRANVWQSFLRPPFAAAAMVAVAILAHAFMVRPAATPAGTAAMNTAAMQAAITAQIEKVVSARVDSAVSKAVADTEQRE